MKKTTIIFLSALPAILLSGCWDFTTGFDADGYKILTIKDAAFRELLIEQFDANGDGQLSWYEASCVKTLDCNNTAGERQGISSIDEIGYFPNIITLDMAGNNLSGTIDLTRQKQLASIDFSSNSASSPGKIKKIRLDIGRKDGIKSITVDEGTEIEYYPEDNTIINFFDEAFKARMVAQFDTNRDREISVAEAENAEAVMHNGAMKVVIDCDNSAGSQTSVTSINEIRYFRYAQVLLFAGNDISGAIDLTRLKSLEEIDFRSTSTQTPGRITEIRLDKGREGKIIILKDEETVIKYQ